MAKDKNTQDASEPAKRISGIVSGLSNLMERLNEVAERAGEATGHTFEVGRAEDQGGKPLKGVLGFTIKLGLGGEGVKVEPFGNVRCDEATGRNIVEEVREPLVDVFDEDERILIVAEMPGVEAGDVHFEVEGELLTLSAERGEQRYRKEVAIPAGLDREKVSLTSKNGIVQLEIPKPGGEKKVAHGG